MPSTRSRHWVRWLLVTVAALVVLAVAGPFVYIHFFDGSTPAALSLSPSTSAPATGSAAPVSTQTASTAASGPVTGAWTVGSGSTVGYRVNEVLLGQSATAVGRTSTITGHLTIAGSAVTAAAFSARRAG